MRIAGNATNKECARFDTIKGESQADYIARVGPLLPFWPEEVLLEWLHHHPGTSTYVHLDYTKFRFEALRLPLREVPGVEASDDPDGWSDFATNLDERANDGDWLAIYMLRHGTWPSPIILLDTSAGVKHAARRGPLQAPRHLLEGHRRLAMLEELRRRGAAAPNHDVWLVRLAQ